ncbi:Gag-Pol polyprotein/retrotransposon [Rhizoctonia solani]|uniref:Gag-Pol polyprotein/retrotransposon n=1 Tax=Rhizoctonia solani TaxID=456999 RepID=A0A8H8T376_9AGAM|nr:Gag-Pol polyprotein/retrotransposon [Rhizoctonia solani]QRW26323.1 Gag-Pol polyprotein/retrotransposon [Rhizoctonia solani]
MAESLSLPKYNSPSVDRTLYQQGVGSLMYGMISTWPNIAYATGLLAQHAANPGKEHWSALLQVLRYLQATKDLGIVYDSSKNSELIGFVDADYAGDPHTSRSTTGWTFILAGGAIAWSLRKQPTISLSSTEAKYVAAASAAREILWIRSFLSELGFLTNGPTALLTNNQSSIALAKNPSNHQNTKHIRVKYHFIRELIAFKEIELKFIPTNEQVANVLTKPLGRLKFPKFITDMGSLVSEIGPCMPVCLHGWACRHDVECNWRVRDARAEDPEAEGGREENTVSALLGEAATDLVKAGFLGSVLVLGLV